MLSWKQQQTAQARCNAASQMPYRLGCRRNKQSRVQKLRSNPHLRWCTAHVNANSYHTRRNPGSAFVVQVRRCRLGSTANVQLLADRLISEHTSKGGAVHPSQLCL
jgi:hypothetical protein